MLKHVVVGLCSSLLVACSANTLKPEAYRIELVDTKPEGCTYLGEVYGSQGNWFTGDFTSNKNLMEGARNELRNEAARFGGDVVQVQDVSHTRGADSLGTTATTIVGKVYRCGRNEKY